jgi:hypothetical protein
MSNEMTETSIIKILAASIDDKKFPYQLPNCFIYMWECDYWTMTKDGETREFEIKISRQDYLKDAGKEKHKEAKGANYFYYVCPDGLIDKSELDKRYGLIYVTNNSRLVIMRKPKRLNNNVFDQWRMLANKMYWKWWALWRQKWIDKEITRQEWMEGFNVDLTHERGMFKTSEDWKQELYPNLVIIDPDGWDRSNYEYSFCEEKITKEEFEQRLMRSTVNNLSYGTKTA